MQQQILRASLEEAQKKDQVGLLIWSNWKVWDDHAFDMRQGNENYDFVLTLLKDGEEATITFNTVKMPGIIAVSVEKLATSPEFLNRILKVCQKSDYTGPITLIPMNKVSDASNERDDYA